MGMYVAGFIIAFLSIFASVGAISSEIEQGSYLAVVSKPIHRFEMVLGRWDRNSTHATFICNNIIYFYYRYKCNNGKRIDISFYIFSFS